MGKAQTNEKHPKGFYACCITFMFERLAFYGAKPILLLFLILQLYRVVLVLSEQMRQSWQRI